MNLNQAFGFLCSEKIMYILKTPITLSKHAHALSNLSLTAHNQKRQAHPYDALAEARLKGGYSAIFFSNIFLCLQELLDNKLIIRIV